VNGRKLIVVERYDRVVASGGNVTRLHQEDFCQALGIPPDKKYQEDGGPSLRRVAQLLDAAAEPGSVESLLRATTLNVLIGNGDAHGKNFSLLHDRPGVLRLAPLYDVMSTLIYGQDRLAMRLDKVTRTSRVTGARIVAEAATWGLSKRRAAEIVADVLDRAADAVAAAASEAPNTPTKLLSLVQAQSVALRDLAVSDP
jgi:serine/threonine-protein kinase HipA